MVRLKKLFIVTILLILSFSNLCKSKETFLLSDKAEINVLGFGSDTHGAFCEDFKLSHEQVKLFFKKAKQKTYSQIHQEFDWLPCFAYGNIIDNFKKYKWEIRLIGIGIITTESGSTIWVGCKNCEEIFSPHQSK